MKSESGESGDTVLNSLPISFELGIVSPELKASRREARYLPKSSLIRRLPCDSIHLNMRKEEEVRTEWNVECNGQRTVR